MKSLLTSLVLHYTSVGSLKLWSNFDKNTHLHLFWSTEECSHSPKADLSPIARIVIPFLWSFVYWLGVFCEVLVVILRGALKFLLMLWWKRWFPWLENVWEGFCWRYCWALLSLNCSMEIYFGFSPRNRFFGRFLANYVLSSYWLNILK